MPNGPERCMDRRGFVKAAVPACALTCLALRGGTLDAAGQGTGQAPAAAQGARHKFDTEYAVKPTYRQRFGIQYGAAFIPFIRVVEKAIGKEKTLALLTTFAEDDIEQTAQAMTKLFGGNDLEAIKKLNSRPELANVWTAEIVQSDDTVHELRVTECLWATTFRQANLADEGHAAICHGDFALVRALNPKLSLIRDKTLMQGHDCCNTKYVLKP